MVRKCSWDGRLQGVLCRFFLCCLTVQYRDMGSRLQFVLSVDNDLLVGLEAGINQRLAVADLRDLDWARLDGEVRFDDVSVGSVRTFLRDRCGDRQAVVPR